MTNDGDQRRNYFRLRYPINKDKPTACLGGREFEILEISEHGARILVPSGSGIFSGQSLSGSFHFYDGAIVLVRGVVSRVESDQIILKLATGVSFKRILLEQKQVLKGFCEHRLEIVPGTDE
jgi:PilZ domain